MFYGRQKPKTAILLLLLFILLFASCHNSGTAENPDEQTADITENTTAETGDVSGDALTENTEQPKLVIDTVSAAAGDTVELLVKIRNNPGIAGAMLTVAPSDGLELKQAENADAFASLDYTPPGKLEGSCVFQWDSESGQAEEDGAILRLTLKVSDDAQPGETLPVNISYKIGDIYDEALNDIEPEIVNGGVTVQ